MNKTPTKSNSAPETGQHQAKPGQRADINAPGASVPPKQGQSQKGKGGVSTPAPHKNAGTTP
ncbi:MAG TPA: hypothetical protein VFW93_13050 [Aquabacterium sp.]|uniref:hypothetical protein n=1 Tax=Aquabacterium sp. TaxID=1872578 RepID=UPI002E342CAC|nr:hypothetical protein [Aquabacterium sp.]HEX5357141.1 hypothetical protein [Aquabacterium sp.]